MQDTFFLKKMIKDIEKGNDEVFWFIKLLSFKVSPFLMEFAAEFPLSPEFRSLRLRNRSNEEPATRVIYPAPNSAIRQLWGWPDLLTTRRGWKNKISIKHLEILQLVLVQFKNKKVIFVIIT